MRTEITYQGEGFFSLGRLTILGVLLVSLASCGGDGDEPKPQCQNELDCNENETCVFGRCVPETTGTDTDETTDTGTDTSTGTETETEGETDTGSGSDEGTETEDLCQDPEVDCPDDGNACTTHVCEQGECVLKVRDGEACTSDTNPCTDEICVNDTCTLTTLDAVPCEFDDNDCTNDLCLQGVCSSVKLDGTSCTFDSDPCTLDICIVGVCSGKPLSGTPCAYDTNDCTNDVCESGVCVAYPLTGSTCNDDGNECTSSVCNDGVCKTTKLSGIPCTADANECTRDRCDDGVCTAENLSNISCGPLGSDCLEDVCVAGTCGKPLGGSPCNADDNECTADICSAEGVCESTSLGAGASCDDGLRCSGYLVCDDADTCGPMGGTVPCPAEECKSMECVEPAPGDSPICNKTNLTGVSCDNDLFCDGSETCQDGICELNQAACSHLTASECQSVACTEPDSCQVVHLEDNVSCADGDLCDGKEVCMGGVCSAGAAACETNNDCTAQECTDLGGSVVCGDDILAPDGTVCSVDSVCYGTGTQLCLAGMCSHGENPICAPEDNDGSFCSRYTTCVSEVAGPDCKFAQSQEFPLSVDTLSCELSDAGVEKSSSHLYSTGFANNEVSTYTGCGSNFTGGEAGYSIVVAPNASFTVNLVSAGTTVTGDELYLFHVTDPCNTSETNCAAFGQGSITSTADGSGEAFIVIDGLNGNRGEGTISLECP